MERYEESLDDLLNCEKIGDIGVSDLKLIAQCYEKLKKFEDSITYYTRALELAEEPSDIYSLRGVAYGEIGEYEKGVEDLTVAIDKNPSNMVLHLYRSNYNLELKLYNEAIKDYNIILGKDKESRSVVQNRGNCYYLTGNLKSALEDFEKLLEIDPEDEESILTSGEILFKLNEFERSYDRLLLLKREDLIDKAQPLMAQSLYMLKRYDEALDILDQLLTEITKDAKLLIFKGVILIESGMFEKGISLLDKAEDLESGDLDDDLLRDLYIKRGIANYLTDNHSSGDDDFNRAKELVDDSDLIVVEKMKVLERVNRFEELIEESKLIDSSSQYYHQTLQLKLRSYISLSDDKSGEETALKLKKYEPSNYSYDLILANIYFGRESHREAIEYYSIYIDNVDEVTKDILVSRGKSYYEEEEYSKAKDDISKAIELDSGDKNLYLVRAKIDMKLNLFEEAAKDYESILKSNPDDSDTLLKLAKLYTDLNRGEDAIEIYNRVIVLDPESPDLYYSLGNLWFVEKRFDDAIENYNKAIKLGCEKAQLYNNLAHSYMINKEYDKAEWFYEKSIEIDNSNPISYKDRGKLYKSLRDWDAALVDIDKGIELSKKDPELYLLKGEISYELGSKNSCEQYYNRAIELSDLPEFRRRRALYYYREKRFDLFVEDLESIDNLSTSELSMRALGYFKLEKFEDAVKDYSSLVDLEPNNPDLLFKRGNCYMKCRDFNSAIADYEKVIELLPNLIITYSSLAFAYANIGEMEKFNEIQKKFIDKTHMMPFRKKG
jgi:tetratricopeptide (TPR) repeat protein